MEPIAEGMVDGEAYGKEVFIPLPIGLAEGDLGIGMGRIGYR